MPYLTLSEKWGPGFSLSIRKVKFCQGSPLFLLHSALGEEHYWLPAARAIRSYSSRTTRRVRNSPKSRSSFLRVMGKVPSSPNRRIKQKLRGQGSNKWIFSSDLGWIN